MICNHFYPHTITPPKNDRDRKIKAEMQRLGWFDRGYCPEYYPEWLYRTIGEMIDKGDSLP